MDSFAFSSIFVILIGLFIFFCIRHACKKERRSFFEVDIYCRFLFLLIPLFFVLFIFIYSNVKKESSVFVYRYFAVILPLLMLFAGAILRDLYDLLVSKAKVVSIISIVLACVFVIGAFIPLYVKKVFADVDNELESFEDAADMIMNQPEVVNGEKVLVINTTNCGRGWRYYLTHDNTRDISNITLMDLDDYKLENDFSKYDTIYLFVVHHDYTFNPIKMRGTLKETHTENVYMQTDNVWKINNDIKIPYNVTYSYICKFEKIH